MLRGDFEFYRGKRNWSTLILRNVRNSHAPAEWREILLSSQVPYAKIMGCAQSGTMRAASRKASSCDAVRPSVRPLQ